jgi:hypothetical protein
VTTNDWITIGLSVIGLLFGSGVVKQYLDRKDARRKEQQAILDEFLLPLEAILNHNRDIHATLTADQELKSLEFEPAYLQRSFAALSPSDPRRATWRGLIEGVISDNDRAKALIQRNGGNVLSVQLKQSLSDFMLHADSWSALWKASIGDDPISEDGRRLSTPLFPDELDRLIAQEIAARRQLAGSSPHPK